MEELIKEIQNYKDQMLDRSLIKFFNPIKWIANKIAIHKLDEKLQSIIYRLTNDFDYESIRQMAQLYYYFYPGIGHSVTIAGIEGQEFYNVEISNYELFPAVMRVLSEDHYVEISIKLTIAPPVSIMSQEIDYIFIFRDNGDIDIDVSRRYINVTTQHEEVTCIKNAKRYNYNNDEFKNSNEYMIFERTFVDILIDTIDFAIEN